MFFKKKPVVGLDLGSFSLKCSSKGEHWSSPLLPDRRQKDDALEPDPLAERIHQLTAEHKLTGTVNMVIPGQGTVARYLEFPPLSAKELKVAGPAQAEGHIPYDLADTNVSYLQVPPLQVGDKKSALFFIADQKERVRLGAAVLKTCGLKVNRMEVPLLSLLRQYQPRGEDAVMLVHCGFTLTHALVVRGRHPYYYREIRSAGRDFTYAFQQGEQCEWAHAEAMKLAYDVESRETAVEPFLQQWIKELERSRQTSPVKPERVLLSGGTAAWKNLDVRLGRDLKLPVELSPAPAFAVADGLAKEDG